MKRLTVVVTAAALVAGVFAVQAAHGQYYTPLRYDLRYTSPTYIPSGALRYGPPQQADPYRYGAPLPGNLGVTGNLRLGKSFHGSSPYGATGSQLSESLPSARLSNFQRDSFGVADLGTNLEYGYTAPYFSETESVTTPMNAGLRFRYPRTEDQIRRVSPNYNVIPYTEPLQAPGNIFTGPGGWTGVTPEIVRRLAALETAAPAFNTGYAETPLGITDMRRLEGLGLPEPPRHEEEAAAAAAAEEADRLESPYDAFKKQFRTDPMNLFRTDQDSGQPPEAAGLDEAYRLEYGLDTGPERPEPWLPQDEDEFAAQQPFGLGAAETLPAAGLPPWADVALPGEEGDEPPLPERRELPLPVPTRPESGYAAYVLRAHDAMKRGVYSQAEALYAAGVALEPDRPAAFFGRINALLAGRMYLQAALVLRRGLGEHPDWAKHAPDPKAVFSDVEMVRRIYTDVKREAGRGARGHEYTFLMGYLEFVAGNFDAARPLLMGSAGSRTGQSDAERALMEAMSAE